MNKYVKRKKAVEAKQYVNATSSESLLSWVNDADVLGVISSRGANEPIKLRFTTRVQDVILEPGMWVVHKSNGKWALLTDLAFRTIYAEVIEDYPLHALSGIQWHGTELSTREVLIFMGQSVDTRCNAASDAFEAYCKDVQVKGLPAGLAFASIGDWVIKTTTGTYLVYSNEQYQAAFGSRAVEMEIE